MVSTVQESDLVHIINQLFELEKKTLLMDNATSLQRPLRRIQQSMDRMGYRWENPLGDKFEDYQQLDSLEDYVLISQESQQVECRRRISKNSWETVIYGAGDDVLLKSIDLRFAIAQLYRGLDG